MTSVPGSAPLPPSTSAATRLPRLSLAAPELWVAGLAFALFSTLRPFSDEVSRDGAAAFASANWILAHTSGILASTLLGVGLARLTDVVEVRRSRARLGRSLAWAGIGVTLPYYGAEVFGLHAAGQQALASGNIAQFDDLTQAVWWEAGIWFLLGLLLLAAGLVVLVTAAWRKVTHPQLLLPLTAAVVLSIPQFAAAQPIRIAHGLLMALGCLAAAAVAAGAAHARPDAQRTWS